MMKTFEDVYAVASVLRFMITSNDDVIWYEDGNEVHAGIVCSDMFWWGVADDEPVEAEDIPLLQSCRVDLDAIDKASDEKTAWRIYTGELFCARKRKMRPQGAFYKHIPDVLWPLFNACGPHRPGDLGNPYPTPEA